MSCVSFCIKKLHYIGSEPHQYTPEQQKSISQNWWIINSALIPEKIREGNFFGDRSKQDGDWLSISNIIIQHYNQLHCMDSKIRKWKIPNSWDIDTFSSIFSKMINWAKLLQVYSFNTCAQYACSSLSPHDHAPLLSLRLHMASLSSPDNKYLIPVSDV